LALVTIPGTQPTQRQWRSQRGRRVFVSNNFAQSWGQHFDIPSGAAIGAIFAMSFASPTRLFMGTTRGKVFRADRSGTTWKVIQLDNATAGSLTVVGLITDVAVDWADANRQSAYIAFGGMGTAARVWWFRWCAMAFEKRAPGNNLLNVEHNALAVDPVAPNNVYVGADIGVWHSDDRGQKLARVPRKAYRTRPSSICKSTLRNGYCAQQRMGVASTNPA